MADEEKRQETSSPGVKGDGVKEGERGKKAPVSPFLSFPFFFFFVLKLISMDICSFTTAVSPFFASSSLRTQHGLT